MKQASIPMVLMLGLLLGLPPRALLAQLVPRPIDELRRLAEQKEEELAAAQAAAASARAQLARAQGKLELAASEWRDVLLHREARLKRVRELLAQGRLCTDEPLQEAEGAVAVGRVWLADVEGRRDVLRVELPRAISYYEWRARRYRTLRRKEAISEVEVREALKGIEDERRWARARLDAL
jgi:hypothetical protein